MLLSALKANVRRRLELRLFHKPLVTLAVDNLYAFLDALEKTSTLHGPVVEIGVAKGYTSAIAATFLARRGSSRRYMCIDTFAGFTAADIEKEREARPFDERHATSFRDIQLKDVRQNFANWGVSSIETYKADICSFDLAAAVKGRISVAMVDVDLVQPCYEGIRRSFDLLDEGGVIVVDDVTASEWGGANIGYRKFCEERGIEPAYYCSFGVVEKTKGTTGWPMRTTPGDDCPYNFNPRVPIPKAD